MTVAGTALQAALRRCTGEWRIVLPAYFLPLRHSQGIYNTRSSLGTYCGAKAEKLFYELVELKSLTEAITFCRWRSVTRRKYFALLVSRRTRQRPSVHLSLTCHFPPTSVRLLSGNRRRCVFAVRSWANLSIFNEAPRGSRG